MRLLCHQLVYTAYPSRAESTDKAYLPSCYGNRRVSSGITKLTCSMERQTPPFAGHAGNPYRQKIRQLFRSLSRLMKVNQMKEWRMVECFDCQDSVCFEQELKEDLFKIFCYTELRFERKTTPASPYHVTSLGAHEGWGVTQMSRALHSHFETVILARLISEC